MTSRTFVVAEPKQVERIAAFLRAQLAEHPLSVAVEKWRKKRSLSANSRYWLVTGMAAEQAGMDKEELHKQNCGDYFGWKEGTLFGKPTRVPVRTTTTPDVLDSKKFSEFSTWAEQRYVEYLGVWLE